jgi:hypothetical protein
MGIPENVAARKSAKLCMSLVVEESVKHPEALMVFWKEIYTQIPSKIVSKFAISTPEIKPFTDIEAKRFETQTFPYGQYNGVKISDIPLDYLDWIVDNSELSLKIKRYLLSKRVTDERRSGK